MDAFKTLNLTTPEPKSAGASECKTYLPGAYPEPCEYFKIIGDSEFEVWAPTIGMTTKNSDRTRTELRETDAKGKLFNWKYNSAADHWLRVAMTLLQVCKGGEVVIGQIHVKDSTNRPPLKLSFDKVVNGVGQLTVGFREKHNQKDPKDTALLKGIPVGTRFTYNIHATDDGYVLLSAGFTDADGKRQTGNLKLKFDSSWEKSDLYFKAGLYNQEVADSKTLKTEGSRARFYKLEITHG